jgi:DNA adenine methylase
MTDPFIRWAGSKRQLASVLSEYWKSGYARYVEPFAGSACLFFHLSPASALLGDINAELIQTYRVVRSQPHRLAAILSDMRKSKREYLRLRRVDPRNLPAAERAARFIYLNRFCFNGLYRTNEKGVFNVPYSGRKTGGLPTHDKLVRCSAQLRQADLVAADFGQVLEMTQVGDFVYMDPPFSVRSRRIFKEYDKSVFGPDHVERLRHWMERLRDRNISFLVSYAESDEADLLKRGFTARRVSVRRHIAGFAESRKNSGELLISFTARTT